MKRNSLTSPDEEQKILLQQVADLRKTYNQTLSQEAEAESRAQELRRQLADTPESIALDQEIDNNRSVIDTLQVRLVDLEAKEKELLGKFSEQSFLVQNVRDQIRMVRNKLAEQGSRRNVRSRSGINPVHQATAIPGHRISD
jgi:chromosome segregation ATPase